MAEFRTDVEGFITREVVEACVTLGIRERPTERKNAYTCFVDPSGGSSDAMTLAIAHTEGKTQILDLIRERKPPFSPEAVTEEVAKIIRSYRCTKVCADRYWGEWPREQFRKHGVNHYRHGPVSLINSVLSICLERSAGDATHKSTANRGKPIDTPGGHDDVANAVAGALVTAYKEPGGANFRNAIIFPKVGVA
jgi:hypothetical protein